MFTGSYDSQDVAFLIDPITVNGIGPQLQYAAEIADHRPLEGRYGELIAEAVVRNGHLVARDVTRVARYLAATHKGDIVLASLVCAGTPVGVLIHHALAALGRKSYHYAISTVRNRGLDYAALDYILERHAAHSVVFVDGWTGKGFIASEIAESIEKYNHIRNRNLGSDLVVLSDLAGVATFAGSADDYLIPSAMLRATANGLTGPSMLNKQADSQFDACLYFPVLSAQDRSKWLVKALLPYVHAAINEPQTFGALGYSKESVQKRSGEFVRSAIEKYHLQSRNWVKPGIGEAARALLTRKVPMTLLLKDRFDADLEHLVYLAQYKDCRIEYDPTLAYRAAVLLLA